VIRRLTGLAAALAAVLAGVVWAGAGGAGPDPYRVAAVFDNADFLVEGQQVKVAGAPSGSVEKIGLTPDRHARIEMTVRRGLGPFRSDARCEIRPESLIGEKFVQCEPGTADGQPLEEVDGLPTVPLERNSSPVDLDIVFSALRLPYRQRLTLLVNELGVGLAGRPEALNSAIRRANPALAQINRMLRIVDRDRRTLAQLIDDSDIVLAELARRRGDVAGFVERADRVAEAVASRRGDLDLAIRRLPAMLEQLEPAATDLAALATDARPVANDLRDAAGPAADLLGDFEPLTEAARPTLVAVRELSRTGRKAVRSATPVADGLAPVARRLPETLLLARQLTESLRDRGAVEGLLSFLYYGTASMARFDRHSHMLPSYQLGGTCNLPATEPEPACSARWGRASEGQKAEGGRRKADRKAGGREGGRRPRPSAPSSGGRPPASSGPGAPSPASPASPAPSPPAPPAVPPLPDPRDLLDYLLGS
jgi:ABC-type transporter Mla subunit MlaD